MILTFGVRQQETKLRIDPLDLALLLVEIAEWFEIPRSQGRTRCARALLVTLEQPGR
jgi:hypothetical protein